MNWTPRNVRDLVLLAGEVSLEDICKYIKQPADEVITVAGLVGVDIRFFERSMEWCPSCATYRTFSPDCRVCELREQLDGLYADNAEAYEQLSAEEKKRHNERDAQREHSTVKKPKFASIPRDLPRYERDKMEEEQDKALEEWEIEILENEKDRVKQETCRLRRKLGD